MKIFTSSSNYSGVIETSCSGNGAEVYIKTYILVYRTSSPGGGYTIPSGYNKRRTSFAVLSLKEAKALRLQLTQTIRRSEAGQR